MKKKYIVYQDGTYFSTDVLGNFTCTKNPLQALMFDSYEAALALRNKRSERAVIPARIHSIVFEVNTENKLNENLIELDNSIKRINEIKLTLEQYCMNNIYQEARSYNTIMKALEFASKIHKHQKRTFTNEPYINHPIRVANNKEVLRYGSSGICVALLHDCIEDAEYPEESDKYISEHFPGPIYESIKLLTHDRLEKSYEEYIETIMTSGNELAIVVKYADSLDNSVPTSNMDEKWIERCRKYRKNSDIYLECLQQTKKNNSLLKGN